MNKFREWIKPYRYCIALLMCVCVVNTYFQLMLPKSLGDLVEAIIGAGTVPFGKGIYMLGVTVVVVVSTMLITILSAGMSTRIAAAIRNELYYHIMTLSKKEMDTLGVSSLITKSTDDITNIQNMLMGLFRTLLTAPVMFIGGSILAFQADKRGSVYLFLSVPVLLFIKAVVVKKTIPMHRTIQKKVDGINKVVREQLRGIRDIRAFNRQEYEQDRFNAYNKDYRDESIRVGRITAALKPLTSLLMNLFTLVIMWFGAQSVLRGSTSIGNYVALSQYTAEVYKSITLFSMFFSMYPRAYASYKRICDVLDVHSSIKDGNKTIDEPVNRITFDNVSFGYGGYTKNTISNFSFEVQKGQVTAIVGSTGSGKSTIADLLTRSYDADSGAILFNGIDIKEFTLSCVRSKTVKIGQKPVLFNGTIKENIAMTKNSIDEKALAEAISSSVSDRIIDGTEGGLDYVVSQGGTNLSGGQKQRLSIARALMKNADVYIFDDCFSALDYQTDKAVRENIKDFLSDKITIIISQRIRTIIDADKIIVVDKGKIAGMGRHNELLLSCKEYAELVLSQKEVL